MRPHVLVKSEVTAAQAMKQVGLLDQAEQKGYEKNSIADSTIIIVRWLSAFYCLACWYGVYRVITFLLS